MLTGLPVRGLCLPVRIISLPWDPVEMPSLRAAGAALSRFWEPLPPFVLEVAIIPRVSRLGLAGG